jgi:hypothetical protein
MTQLWLPELRLGVPTQSLGFAIRGVVRGLARTAQQTRESVSAHCDRTHMPSPRGHWAFGRARPPRMW